MVAPIAPDTRISPRVTQLLFVCLGNICRSPSAENIMVHLLAQRQITHIQCDSAGTSSYHIGSPPDRRMAAAAAEQGITLQGRGAPISSPRLRNLRLDLGHGRR
jgi:protein-tyrosine-phosphatase